jgi:hypothetical protein
VPSVGVLRNTEPASALKGPRVPFGDMDLDPGGVDVDANREDTELFDLLYGRLEIEDTND